MKVRTRLTVAAAAAVLVACSSLAHAQATRTWVSGVGDDANPCSRSAPCKTFAGAISKTATGGEISVLDPGGFGAVTITKAITINGEGTLAGILSAGIHGVIVNITTINEGDAVILRNLSINGAGTGLDGIRFLAGGALVVENCTISGVLNGIDVAHDGARAASVSVSNTTLTDIGGAAVLVGAAAGVAPSAHLSNVRISGVGTGLRVLRGAATIADSFISGVENEGIAAESGEARVNAEGCVVDDAGVGVAVVSAGARVRISNCDIFQNATGVSVAAGGKVESFGNNRIRGNATNVAGTLTKVAQQ